MLVSALVPLMWFRTNGDYNLATLYHHLNFGWSGNYNAWYTLPDSGADDFTWVSELVYNVWTNGTGEIISGRILSRDGLPVAGAVVTAVRSGGGRCLATSNARGIYALAQAPSSSTYSLTVRQDTFTFTNQTVATGLSSSNSPDAGHNPIDYTAARLRHRRPQRATDLLALHDAVWDQPGHDERAL